VFRAGPGPAAAQFRQGQIGRELPAAVPDDPAIFRRMMPKADRVPRHVAGVSDAVPLADGYPGAGEAGEELLLRARPGRCGRDLAAQGYPGRLRPAAPGRLLRLGAGRPPGRGAIRRGSSGQPEPCLGSPACLPYPIEVVPDLRPGAVLPGQGCHQMNVIRGMPDCNPPNPQVITLTREPGTVHDLLRDLRPLGVGQDPVTGRGADRAMPHRLVIPRAGQGGQRLG
jgi:hypothetical protein